MAMILLVAGDNLPAVQVLLTDKTTGLPLNMSAAGTTVTVKMRAAGTTTVLATIPGNFDATNGVDGIFTFAFAGNTLNVAPGLYEFEIVINWNGSEQTVFDILRARVRAAF